MQLANYFEHNNIIYPNQYGFRKKHSTEYASLHLVDYISYSMETMSTPLNIFLDLSKAFDTLNHDILLAKLEHYGLNRMAYNLLSTYLRNRKQYVQFESTSSDELHITHGVPQGSILGPLLFIIYINDLPHASKLFDFLMYADDTTLCCCIDNIDGNDKENVLNNELQHVNKWLTANKLSLNVNKTKYMLYFKHPKVTNDLNLSINNNYISRVNAFNFLGLQMNCNLNWNNHIEYISNKIMRTTGMLHRIKEYIPSTILRSLYNTLILPHINYCILSWGKQCDNILLLQKRAVRVICSANTYNAHTEPLFKSCNLLKVTDIYETKMLVFYHNLLLQSTPNHFNSFTPSYSTGNLRYPIRDPKFKLPSHSHEYTKLTCRYQLPSLLNMYILSDRATDKTGEEVNFSNLLRNSRNIPKHTFKKLLKSHYISEYSTACRVQNCYICQNRNSLDITAS